LHALLVRTFIAVNLPPEIRRAIFDGAAAVRELLAGARWVSAENIHLTLKFLGQVEEARLVAVSDALDEVARAHRSFLLTVEAMGVFPNSRSPRVVWAGIRAEPRLELLHHDVERACEAVGFPVEGRAFRPHMTLSRVKEPLPTEMRSSVRSAIQDSRLSGQVQVHTVDLMRSETGKEGSRYQVVHAAPLGG
jgi:2'-5' RNA ligase